MRDGWLLGVRSSVSRPVAAIVVVIVVCGTALTIGGQVLSSNARISEPDQGLFQVAVTSTSLRSGDFLSTNAGTGFVCGSPAGSFLAISNMGFTKTSVVVAAAIYWAGQINGYSPATGSTCTVGSESPSESPIVTQSLLFTDAKLLASARSGGTFIGTVAFSNGAVLNFIGTFQ